MFAKLLTLIIIAGLTALALLLTRQEQIDTVHEMTRLHHRLQEQRHAVWSLRNEIANACRPSVIEKLRSMAPDQWVEMALPQTSTQDHQQNSMKPDSEHVEEELRYGG